MIGQPFGEVCKGQYSVTIVWTENVITIGVYHNRGVCCRERSVAEKRARGAAARVRQWPPGLRGVKIDSERGTDSEQHDSELARGSSV